MADEVELKADEDLIPVGDGVEAEETVDTSVDLQQYTLTKS